MAAVGAAVGGETVAGTAVGGDVLFGGGTGVDVDGVDTLQASIATARITMGRTDLVLIRKPPWF
jgi:hypothetical protein